MLYLPTLPFRGADRMVEELEDCTVAKFSACEKLVVCTVEELEVCTVEELEVCTVEELPFRDAERMVDRDDCTVATFPASSPFDSAFFSFSRTSDVFTARLCTPN